MVEKSDVSVVIPSYNGEPWIRQAILSVLNQIGAAVDEVIVVDDCSSDDTCRRVLEIQDSRLRLVRMESNSGVAAARNRGLAEVTTTWVGFNDQDDIWLSDKLVEQVELLRRHPSADAVVGGEARLAADGVSRWSGGFGPVRWSPQHIPSLARPPFYDPATDGDVYLQSLILKTQLANKVKFKNLLPLADDLDFIHRVCETATQTLCVAKPVFLYHLGSHNQTAPGRVKAALFLAVRAYVYEAQRLRKEGKEDPDPKTFIESFEATEDEITRFLLNQEMRLVNTIWINRGLPAAIERFLTRSLFVSGSMRYVRDALGRRLFRRVGASQ